MPSVIPARLAVVVFAFSALFVAVPVAAQDCAILRWVQVNNVSINAGHIFCGELPGNQPKGFHSMALAASASANLIAIPPTPENPVAVGNGIYNATVIFRAGPVKFSTFFPDACTYAMVLNSISFAFLNQTGPHPVWGVLGPSAPAPNAAGYCLGTNGNPFDIRMGLINGATEVNTAFPSM